MSPSIATPTCSPTPVRNPTSTVRDRKSARKPALKTRASRSRPAVSSVSMPTSAMYFSLPSGAMRESEPEKIAAVAEISRHDEMARGAEDGEGDERQKDRVKAGDDGRAGDAGIAENLRNVHRGEGHAGECVPQPLARLDREKAAENVEPHRAGPCAPALPTVAVKSPFPPQSS